MSVITDIQDYSAYMLAGLAECGSPDDSLSPGAAFLTEIRDSFLESLEELDSDETVLDRIQYVTDHGQDWEMVGNAIDDRTHQMWLQFTDVQAYYEEIETEFDDSATMEDRAHAALEQIGQRLVSALMQEIEGSGEFDTDEGGEVPFDIEMEEREAQYLRETDSE